MADVFQVSAYLVYLAHTAGEPDRISTKKLQKLLYYAQGIFLAKNDTALFTDKIKAWVEGPVIPCIWHQYKEQPALNISACSTTFELTIEERVFLRQIWKLFGQYTGDALSQRTHLEPPWKKARAGIAPDAKSDVEITPASLCEYFTTEQIVLPPVPRPIEIRKGREVYSIKDAGRILPALV